MQISTSVGVVQDILISLSFQKNAKLIMDPSKSQDQPAGICVNCPVAELACRPSLRSSRASEANVPERAIAHRQKRADRRGSMCQVREAINQQFKVAIRRPVHVCPDIPRVSQGTRWKSYSYSASISNLRGAGHPAALSAAARRPAFCLPCQFIRPHRVVSRPALCAPPSARCRTWES